MAIAGAAGHRGSSLVSVPWLGVSRSGDVGGPACERERVHLAKVW